jgi:hypothetical protein
MKPSYVAVFERQYAPSLHENTCSDIPEKENITTENMNHANIPYERATCTGR